MASSSDHQQARKRLIIKLSYSHQKDDSQGGNKKRRMEKPIVSCYWLDANQPLQKKDNKMIQNQLSATNVVQHTKEGFVKENSKGIDGNFGCNKVDNKITKPSSSFIKDHPAKASVSVSTTNGIKHTKEGLVKENSRFPAKDHSKDKPSSFIKYHPARDEKCCSKTNDSNGGSELMVKKEEKKKKAMEHYKRMLCWVIVKRMIEGRDGWAMKAPLDIKFLRYGLENKSKVKKAIGLKDIEGKLKSYSSPDEFADDMRFVFYHGLCYPRSDDVYRIAARLSDTFEHKWKVLKKEWALEEKRLKYNNHKRKRDSQSVSKD